MKTLNTIPVSALLLCMGCLLILPGFTKLFGSEKFKLSFESRLRLEGKYGAGGNGINNDFIGSGVDNNNAFAYLRTTVAADWKPYEGFGLHLGLRDNSVWGDDRDPSPRKDQFDLFEAYAVYKPSMGQSPFAFKIGRQEIYYGSHILMGRPNRYTSRSWDGIRVSYEKEKYKLDGFVARRVLNDASNRNERDNNEVVYGLYASTNALLKKWNTDFYWFGRNSSEDSGNRNVHSFGTLIKSKKGAYGKWGFKGEFIGQLGTSGASNNKHESFLINLGANYQISKSGWKPKLGLEYYYSPGDKDANDNKTQTFDLFYPGKNHPRAGRIDAVGWRNMHIVGLTFDAVPTFRKGMKLNLAYYNFWLANTSDYLYGQGGGGRTKNGYGINTGNNSHVGQEISAELKCKINKSWSVGLELAHFFTGDYIDQSLSASGSRDATQVFTTLRFKF